MCQESFEIPNLWIQSAVAVMNDIVESPKEAAFTKKQELRSFLFLSVVTAPVLAVIIVAGWGFLVWMYQIFAGPPGS